MPVEHSNVKKSGNAVLDHSAAREITVLARDVRAPIVEFSFDL